MMLGPRCYICLDWRHALAPPLSAWLQRSRHAVWDEMAMEIAPMRMTDGWMVKLHGINIAYGHLSPYLVAHPT